jgi:hypothetical protein
VISSAVALGLLVFAGYFLYSKVQPVAAAERASRNRRTSSTASSTSGPNPGNKKVDNIAAAQEQTERLTEFAQRAQSPVRQRARTHEPRQRIVQAVARQHGGRIAA